MSQLALPCDIDAWKVADLQVINAVIIIYVMMSLINNNFFGYFSSIIFAINQFVDFASGKYFLEINFN